MQSAQPEGHTQLPSRMSGSTLHFLDYTTRFSSKHGVSKCQMPVTMPALSNALLVVGSLIGIGDLFLFITGPRRLGTAESANERARGRIG